MGFSISVTRCDGCGLVLDQSRPCELQIHSDHIHSSQMCKCYFPTCNLSISRTGLTEIRTVALVLRPYVSATFRHFLVWLMMQHTYQEKFVAESDLAPKEMIPSSHTRPSRLSVMLFPCTSSDMSTPTTGNMSILVANFNSKLRRQLLIQPFSPSQGGLTPEEQKLTEK